MRVTVAHHTGVALRVLSCHHFFLFLLISVSSSSLAFLHLLAVSFVRKPIRGVKLTGRSLISHTTYSWCSCVTDVAGCQAPPAPIAPNPTTTHHLHLSSPSTSTEVVNTCKSRQTIQRTFLSCYRCLSLTVASRSRCYHVATASPHPRRTHRDSSCVRRPRTLRYPFHLRLRLRYPEPQIPRSQSLHLFPHKFRPSLSFESADSSSSSLGS